MQAAAIAASVHRGFVAARLFCHLAYFLLTIIFQDVTHSAIPAHARAPSGRYARGGAGSGVPAGGAYHLALGATSGSATAGTMTREAKPAPMPGASQAIAIREGLFRRSWATMNSNSAAVERRKACALRHWARDAASWRPWRAASWHALTVRRSAPGAFRRSAPSHSREGP